MPSADSIFRLSKGLSVTRTAIVASLFVLATAAPAGAAEEDMSDVIFFAHEMHLGEAGFFALKSWHNMSHKEFAYAITGTCPDCKVGLIHYGPETFGPNFMTTGRLDKYVGGRWWVTFPGPHANDGRRYDICSASIDADRDIFLNPGDATTGTLFRNPRTGENWVGTVSEAPAKGPGGHGVDVRFVAKYVVAGTEGSHHCLPNGSRLWNARF